MKYALEKKKYFVINIGTFNVDIAFFINHTHAEMVKASSKISCKLHEMLKKLPDETDEDSTKGRMLPLDQGYACRLWFPKDSFRHNVSLLSHEISHLVTWILLDRRVALSKDSDEVYAYLTEEITRKFLHEWY